MNPFRWEDYIEEHPEVMVGKPVFKGTRLTVELIVKALEAGATQEELLEDFRTLQREHIRAAILLIKCGEFRHYRLETSLLRVVCGSAGASPFQYYRCRK